MSGILVSPDVKCDKCRGVLYTIQDNGRTCIKCGYFMEEFSLEEKCPGITDKIINARNKEEQGEG